MKKQICPQCNAPSDRISKAGTFHRRSDGQTVQRFHCSSCAKTFSEATGTSTYLQKKRRLNDPMLKLFASGMSQNRLAIVLRTTRTTVARKLKFLAGECEKHNQKLLASKPKSECVEFDELETTEHTKCKPLSVALAVDQETRRILGFRVSSMPAKGHLANLAKKKYGKRPDDRQKGLRGLLTDISQYCVPEKLHLKSDECPRYPRVVAAVFGTVPGRVKQYERFKGGRGCVTGQGELKKQRFDPIFSLNHTCAMFRANVNRLFRRTWNTTKKPECLLWHLQVYAYFHNAVLIKA